MKTEEIRKMLDVSRVLIGRQVVIWLIIGVVASFGLAIIEGAIAIFIQILLKALGLVDIDVSYFEKFGASENGLVLVTILLIVIGLVRGLCTLLVCQSSSIVSEVFNARLRLAILFKLLKLDGRQFIPASTINLDVSEIYPKAAKFLQSVTSLASNAVVCACLCVSMFSAYWRESLIGFCGLFVVGSILSTINKTIGGISRIIPTEQKRLTEGVERIARNWLLVNILRMNDMEHRNLSNSTVRYAANSIRASYLTFLGSVLPPTLGVGILVAIIFSHIRFWNDANNMLFVSFLYLFIRFCQYIGTLVRNASECVVFFPQFVSATRSFRDISHSEMKIALQQLNSIRASGLISECVESPTPEGGLKEEDKPDYARPPSIAIEGLFYRYPNCSEFIVNNFTLSIGSGEQIGIVGKSGSGKSTVLAIILGILKPTAGSVRFDGEAPSERLKFGAKFIGYVGAEPFLIDGTIRDNLCYGCLQEVTDAMCWEALALADLDRTVQGMAGQLAYKIAENGDGLSAGQKQRLSLARALLPRPSLLVLDEVSANLDADTELEIANSIRSLKRKCTVVIVSHRPGIIKYADRVVELAAK